MSASGRPHRPHWSEDGGEIEYSMWLFTKYGFYSAVCARTMNDAGPGQGDRDRIVVRARVRRHLEALRSRFPGELADSPVVDDEGTDYAHRL